MGAAHSASGKSGISTLNEHENLDQDGSSAENDSYQIKNALVLLICISKYSGNSFQNLEGAKYDMEMLTKLWKDQFGFQIICNKTSLLGNDYRVTQDQLRRKLDEARLVLTEEKEEKLNKDNVSNNFDSFIFIYSGHGYEEGIVMGKNLNYPKSSNILVQKMFQRSEMHQNYLLLMLVVI